MSLSRASSAGAPQSALVIAAPDASRELPVLVGARDEARRVAEIYAGAVVSDGARASVQEVFRQLPDFPVVHVAAHAVSNANYPLLSRLVLYPDRGNDGGLRVVDMLRSPGLLPGSVVVLAACATMGLVTHRGEGPIGLAWGFLAAGAASVVATLWDVDDRAIASLFVDLHRGLASGKTASDALRAAQLAARERGAPEHVWAAVQVIGQP
jgi:CHAT domain-containing protein